MKYFIDTEFKEEPHTIDLISIGIKAEDGREYYALSKDFNLKKVWRDEWLRDNVLFPIYREYVHGDMRNQISFSRRSIKGILNGFGKTNDQISKEIVEFVNPDIDNIISSITKCDCWDEKFYPNEFKYIKNHNTEIPKSLYSSGIDGSGVIRNKKIIYNQPEFYAYYADYDWVVFCWLFGRMIDLPKGFPMYCKDLKQMLDDVGNPNFKNDVPKTNEHDALADARWNLELYKFIIKH